MALTVKRVNRNVFLSNDSRQNSSKRVRLPEDRNVVIPLGLENRFFLQDAPTARHERSMRILAVGDIYPHKQFETIIEAFPKLLSQHPELALQIAGRPVDSDYVDRLIRKTTDLGIESHVSFLGGVSQDTLAELYDSSMVYVTASKLETFGLTPVEAMSRGLPVVATRNSATPEVCGSAALYFDDSAAGLGETINRLILDQRLWNELQRAGIEHSLRYSWSRIATQYAELIDEIQRME